MTVLSELIERLEKATGPDRELDVAIGFAIGRIRERDGNYLYAMGNDSDMVVEPNDYDDRLVAQPLGYYTASIDAALTLVPEGWGWSVGSPWANETPDAGGWPWSDIWIRGEQEIYLDGAATVTDSPGWNHFNAPTVALALCIASLKARDAITKVSAS